MKIRALRSPDWAFWAAILTAAATLGCAAVGLISSVVFVSAGDTYSAGISVAVILLLGLVLALVITSALLSKTSLDTERPGVFHLALVIVLAALWTLAEGKPSFCAHMHLAPRLMSYFAITLAPMALLMFVRALCKGGRRLTKWLILIFFGFFVVQYAWLAAGKFFSMPPWWVTRVPLYAAMPVSLAVVLREYRRGATGPGRELLFGVSAVTALGIYDFFSFVAYTDEIYVGHRAAVLALFILLLGLGTVRLMSRAFAKACGYEKSFAQTPVGICRARNDAQLTLTYANDTYFNMFGYTQKEAWSAGMRYAACFMREEERARVRRHIGDAIAAGLAEFEFEARRLHRSGAEMWVLSRCHYDSENDIITAALVDVTGLKRTEEELRLSEEELRIAAHQGGKMISRYDVKTSTLYQRRDSSSMIGRDAVVANVPESAIAKGLVAPESVERYIAFFEDMRRGKPSGSAAVRMRVRGNAEFRWYKVDYTLLFDASGAPRYGVISCFDYTALRERELAYEKWQQELSALPKEKATLLEWNLTRDVPGGDMAEIAAFSHAPEACTFDEINRVYMEARVWPEDKPAYSVLLNRERLLGAFGEEEYTSELEYRERQPGGACRWKRLKVQIVQYPETDEIMAYLIVHDIDSEKRMQLRVEQRAQIDALTGVCNRATFVERVQALLAGHADEQHAFIMLDLDGFKQVNDTLGHMEGDRLLSNIAHRLTALLREGDLVGRIGGDEFMLCLRSVPNENVIERRARVIRRLLRVELAQGVVVSGSIGIAMYPRDGQTFDELYGKADLAMYHAKQQGKNRYVFYRSDMPGAERAGSGTPIDDFAADEGEYAPQQLAALAPALRKVEPRGELVLREAGAVTFEWDLEAGEFIADEGFAAYSPSGSVPDESFQPEDALHCAHPDDAKIMTRDIYTPLAEGGSHARATLRLKKADGSYERCMLMISMVYDSDNRATRCVGSIWPAPRESGGE